MGERERENRKERKTQGRKPEGEKLGVVRKRTGLIFEQFFGNKLSGNSD